MILLAWCAAASAQPAQRPDIRKLSQHFIDARDSSPWHFAPAGNIKEVSLSEHRGLVTLREAGKGQDIKGLLKSPLRLDEYPAPWEFHLGILQNHLGQKGLSEKQINYAIGLNLAVQRQLSRLPEVPDRLRAVPLRTDEIARQVRGSDD